MRLSVPAGTIGTELDQVRIMVTGWSLRNDGGTEGYAGGRLILQIGRRWPLPREDMIVDAGWVTGLPVTSLPQGRLSYAHLSAVPSTTDPRRQLLWSPMPVRMFPGATAALGFSVVIGIELLSGIKNIDIVAIAERLDVIQHLPDAEGHLHWRWPEAFSVAEAAPAAFTPVLLGQPTVRVNPF